VRLRAARAACPYSVKTCVGLIPWHGAMGAISLRQRSIECVVEFASATHSLAHSSAGRVSFVY
jgi:hypothetical protein